MVILPALRKVLEVNADSIVVVIVSDEREIKVAAFASLNRGFTF